MNPEDEVSPATISMIAWDVRDGKPDREEIDRVLAYFCNLVDEGKPLPIELRIYLRDSVKAYLYEGATSVDQGLGLVRHKVGRGPADETKQRLMAAAALEARVIDGSKEEFANRDVGRHFGVNKTTVSGAFRKYKGEAKAILDIMRMTRGDPPYTEEQQARLNKIYKKSCEKVKHLLSEEQPLKRPEN